MWDFFFKFSLFVILHVSEPDFNICNSCNHLAVLFKIFSVLQTLNFPVEKLFSGALYNGI